MTDQVSHPPHYTVGGIEVIDVIQAKLTPKQFEGYLFATVIKYTLRYPYKGGAKDLDKADWYLTRLRKFLGDQDDRNQG